MGSLFCLRVLGWMLKLLYTLRGQTAPVLTCSYSSDGQLLASGSVSGYFLFNKYKKKKTINFVIHFDMK